MQSERRESNRGVREVRGENRERSVRQEREEIERQMDGRDKE